MDKCTTHIHTQSYMHTVDSTRLAVDLGISGEVRGNELTKYFYWRASKKYLFPTPFVLPSLLSQRRAESRNLCILHFSQ